MERIAGKNISQNPEQWDRPSAKVENQPSSIVDSVPVVNVAAQDPVSDAKLLAVRERLGMPVAERTIEADETKLEEKSRFLLSRLNNPGLDYERIRENAVTSGLDVYSATLYSAYDSYAGQLTDQWGGPERYTYKGNYNEIRSFDRTKVDEHMLFQLRRLSTEMRQG